MDLYVVELGNVGMDGFVLIEQGRVLASGLEAGKARAVDQLKTRGAQLGARRLRMLDSAGALLWEYP